MRRVLYALVLILAGGMAWIRLAPDDPARWNRPAYGMSEPIRVPGQARDAPGPEAVQAIAGGATAVVKVKGAGADEVLDQLDRIAASDPRTRRIAHDRERGLMSWVTRSAFWGFPDYTTAEAHQDGPDVDLALHARLRYGRYDFGVNAARLRDWLSRLAAK